MEEAYPAVSDFAIFEAIEEVKDEELDQELDIKHVDNLFLIVTPGETEVVSFPNIDSPFIRYADSQMNKRNCFTTLEPDNDVQSDEEKIGVAKNQI